MTKDGYMGQLIEDMMDLGVRPAEVGGCFARSFEQESYFPKLEGETTIPFDLTLESRPVPGLREQISNMRQAMEDLASGDGKESLREHLRETMATDDQPRVPCCGRCGSTSIVVDATVRWDIDAQDWILTRIHDDDADCDECEAGGQLVWKMADDVEVGEEPSDPDTGQAYLDQLEDHYGTIDPETGARLKHGEVQF